jgi:hypothetical protein
LKEIVVAVLVDLWVSDQVYVVCGKIVVYFSTDGVGHLSTNPQAMIAGHLFKKIIYRG